MGILSSGTGPWPTSGGWGFACAVWANDGRPFGPAVARDMNFALGLSTSSHGATMTSKGPTSKVWRERVWPC